MKISQLILFFTLLASLGACRKKGCTDPHSENYNVEAEIDDGSCTYCDCWPVPPVISGNITSDLTLTSDFIYEFTGRVLVTGGATLTIQPGTIVKFREGIGSLASSLIIDKGAKIIAEGTKLNPIIFTSVLDNIEMGQLTGSNLDEYDRGLWGGLIILGNAPVSIESGNNSQVYSLLPQASEIEYGGSNANDNSGSISHLSIRHAGVYAGVGNEYNALTLAGVGYQTNINNIEMVACEDDGIEILGGNINIEQIVSGFFSDEGISIDQGYHGELSQFMIICDSICHHSMEFQPGENPLNFDMEFDLGNGSIENLSSKRTSRFTNTYANIYNVNFDGAVELDAYYDTSCASLVGGSLYNLTNVTSLLQFNNCSRESIIFRSSCAIDIVDSTEAFNVFQEEMNSGITNSDFSWTWLSVNNKL